MRDVSDTFRYILDKGDYFEEVKVVINNYEYFEDSLISVEGNDGIFSENIPVIGSCISGEIDIKMKKPLQTIPRMAIIKPYVRIVIPGEYDCIAGIAIAGDVVGSVHNSIAGIAIAGKSVVGVLKAGIYSEWMQKGTYYIDTRSVTHDYDSDEILTIHGYDQMMMLEQIYPSSTMEYPADDTDVLQEIADFINFNVDPRTWAIMNKHYQIPLPAGYSCREVISFIAASYCCNAIFNEIGELRLVPLKGGD